MYIYIGCNSIINFGITLYLYLLLSIVERPRFSCTQSMKKTAPWCNSYHLKFGSGWLFFIAFTQNLLEGFQNVWLSTRERIIIHVKKSKTPVYIMMFHAVTSNGNFMPLFIFSRGLIHNIEAFIKYPDRESCCWKITLLVTGLITILHKQKNSTHVAKKFQLSHHPWTSDHLTLKIAISLFIMTKPHLNERSTNSMENGRWNESKLIVAYNNLN